MDPSDPRYRTSNLMDPSDAAARLARYQQGQQNSTKWGNQEPIVQHSHAQDFKRYFAEDYHESNALVTRNNFKIR